MKKNESTTVSVNGRDTFVCKRIVAFGDSMVEGAELLDHTLPIGHLKKKMDWNKWSNLLWKDNLMEQHLKNKEESKKLSYPAQLSSILKTDFVNYGVGGNSLESICWQLFDQYEPQPEDLVLIGLPPIERLWRFVGPEEFDTNILLGWRDSYDEYGEKLVDWYDEPRILWEYLKCLWSIYHYKNTTHPHVYVIPQWQSFDYFVKSLPVEWRKSFSTMTSKITDSDLFLLTRPLMWFGWVTKLEHGHPTLSTHKRAADYISKMHVRKL